MFLERLIAGQRRTPPAPVEREDAATLAARELLADGDIRGDLEAGYAIGAHPDVEAAALQIIDAEQAADDAA